MVAALRRLGFDKVFDTDFGADLTIMEEATELLQRHAERRHTADVYVLLPGWVKFCEHYYPESAAAPSSCKSPQQMFGALTKTYYAEQAGYRPGEHRVSSR